MACCQYEMLFSASRSLREMSSDVILVSSSFILSRQTFKKDIVSLLLRLFSVLTHLEKKRFKWERCMFINTELIRDERKDGTDTS